MPNKKTAAPVKYQLAAALKARLVNTSIDKITIKELTDDCGVNRQTFYYHFEDIYDLLKWLCNIEAEQVMQLQDNAVSWKESFASLLNYLSENKSFCLSLLNSVEHRFLKNTLTQYMEQLTLKSVYNEFNENILIEKEKLPEKQDLFDFQIKFYSGAVVSMIERRLLGDIKLSNEKFIEYMEFVIENNIRGISALMHEKKELP